MSTRRLAAPLAAAVALSLLSLLTGCAANNASGTDAAAQSPPPATGFSGEVLGTVNGEDITMDDVIAGVRGRLAELDAQRYEVLREATQMKIDEELVQIAADEQGLTVQELYYREVRDKITEPTEEQIRQAYEQNKSQAGGRTLEELRPGVIRFLQQRQLERLERNFIRQLRNDAGAKVTLEPPRIELEMPIEAPAKGAADAPVTLVEFADFQCGYCKRAHPEIQRLLNEYGSSVRYVFMDYPLENHIRAVPASVAARCAGEQDKFWDYFDNLMVMNGDLSDGDLSKRATDLGLDADAFTACYESNKYQSTVMSMMENGRQVGVTGTPTFFINGRMLIGAKGYDELKSIIEQELERGTTS